MEIFFIGFPAFPVSIAYTDGRSELLEKDTDSMGTTYSKIIELDLQ